MHLCSFLLGCVEAVEDPGVEMPLIFIVVLLPGAFHAVFMQFLLSFVTNQ